MAPDRNLFAEEFRDMGDPEDDGFDPEEDVMPSDTLVIKKEVTAPTGIAYIVEAHITKNSEAEDGISWIKVYAAGAPENFTHFFIDTLNPELILNALENYIAQGKGVEVARFIMAEGRNVRSAVEFRLKLEASLGSVQLGGNVQALASGLF